MSRKSWQEHIGSRPHMIEESMVDAGYTARDSYEVVNRIAIVDISGVLVNAAWDGWHTSSYERIAGEINRASVDPEVDGILLRINSPGGETDNSFETADAIIRAGKQKPVWAVADISAYSAGYLLAAAADRIYVAPKTGGVGSIGVYAVHLDLSGMLNNAGVKPTFIENPKGKTDGHPFKPLSAEAEASIRAEVDRLAEMFFGFVAERRALDPADVRKMRARMFQGGEAAIEARLADRVGTLDTARIAFREHLDTRKQVSRFVFSVAATSAANPQKGESHMVVEQNAKADATAAPPAAEQTAAEKFKAPATPAVQEQAASASEVEEIIALCASAGVSAKTAHEFIAQKKTAKEVAHALLSQRADAYGAEIVSQVQATSGTKIDDKTADVLKSVVAEMGGK